jgi:hypothetical protein
MDRARGANNSNGEADEDVPDVVVEPPTPRETPNRMNRTGATANEQQGERVCF